MIEKVDLIGIALTSYNPEEKLLHRQLKSIQDQTFKEWVCCITIDNDEKETFQKESIKNLLRDSRFKLYYNNTRLGFLKNFETAIGHTLKLKPDAIIMADHDDEWKLKRLELLRNKLIGLPDYSLVHSDMLIRIQKENSDEILKQTVWQKEKRNVNCKKPEMILQRNIVGGATALIDSKLFQLFPIIPEGVQYHDHWYAILSSTLGQIQHINEPLYIYSQHENNIAGSGKYEGILSIKDHQRSSGVIKVSIQKWQYTNFLYKTILKQTNIKLPITLKLLFKNNKDFGIFNFIFSLRYLFYDTALFRSSVAVSIGKFLSSLKY